MVIMIEFIYCFIQDNRINYSGETADGLGSMFSEDEEVKEFIVNSKDSDFLSLKNGDFIFRCSPRKTINYPAPRPLLDVLNSAGLLDG